ncbi:insulin-like growth factor-binding protein complex acid labile subunit [Elysia marginata]|uniref:Insulin-like growth factor-binding protein complex acid labile subunit n=1 Tax=Elysia marginata TaxID=1093978 RepID=A0AAV4JUY8_9GAST|nr:insulin-like growth factor-binding protein complex acid labile subunit [Elysia marginata]
MSSRSNGGDFIRQLLPLVIVACTFQVTICTCPRPPNCYVCSPTRAICKLCPEHPDIPATIKDLKIISGGCSILTQMGLLKTTSLSRYTDLESLSMDHTNVIRLFGSVFEKNVNLRTLSLAQNAIRTFSAQTFKGLTHLKELNLAQSKIPALTPSSFSPLSSLESLNLAGNLLTSLTAHDFDGLGNLLTLSLSNNPLDTLEPDTFKPLASVQEISLKGTELTAINSRLFAGLAALRRVDASGGKIRVVADDSLLGTRLDKLDLSQNNLMAAPYAAIKSATAPPKEINLSHNRIFRLLAHDFQNVSTTKLELEDNPIRLIEAGAFSGSAISELNLANTSLTSLPAAMEAWMLRQKVAINLQDNRAWQCVCSQLWLGRYLHGSPASQSPVCAAGSKYGGRTLVSVLPQIEADCKTTTAPTTTATTPTTSSSTTTTTSTTSTPTTSTTTTIKSTRKTTPQISPSTRKQATNPSSSLANSNPPGHSLRPAGQSPPSSNPPSTQPAGPGATHGGSSSTSNTNSKPNTGGTNSNSNPVSSKPGNSMNANTSPSPAGVQKPGGNSNKSPSQTSPSLKPRGNSQAGGQPGGQPPDQGVDGTGGGTVNMMAVLLAVLCTLAACLFCVGVVAACLSCHKHKSRRGRVEDHRANQVAHALAALSGKWHQQM